MYSHLNPHKSRPVYTQGSIPRTFSTHGPVPLLLKMVHTSDLFAEPAGAAPYKCDHRAAMPSPSRATSQDVQLAS